MIDMDMVIQVLEEGNPDHIGFCIACGDEAYGCEPDARNYECESCGKMEVYGAEECLFMFPM